jgi:CHAD domain-containing protein
VLDAKDPRSLHRVRVALKRHRYLLDAFRHHLTPKLDAERPLLKRLQQRLGAWHDERLFADRLEACAGDLPRQLRTECRALALGRRDLAQAEQHRLVTLLTKKRFR